MPRYACMFGTLSPLLSVAAGASFLPRVLPVSIYATAAIVLISGVAALALWRTRWGAAVGWTALVLAGQACAVQLVDVGNLIRPQIFYGWKHLLTTYRIIFLAALGIQALIVLAAVWRRRRQAGKILRRILPWPAWAGMLALMGFAAIDFAPADVRAAVSGHFWKTAILQAVKSAQGLTIFLSGAVALWLAAAAVPEDAWEILCERWRNRNGKRLVWIAALWVVVVSSLLAWFVFERVPHLPDEVAYAFQAKYLATGRLYLEKPVEPKAFESEFVLVDGDKWYMATTAGWPAVLALGYLLGAPWLVNPLLGGIAILLAHALVRRIYDRDITDATVLLLSLSPWLLFLSASLMPHPLTLVFSLLGLLGVARARSEGSVLWGGVAGFAVGAMLHVRPLDAVILAGVAGVWWLSAGLRKLRPAALGATLAAGVAMTALFLLYNRAITGDPFYPPINRFTDTYYYPGANRIGFGKDVGNLGWTELDPLPGHGPIDVIVNTNINVYLLHFELFGWASGSLVFVFLLAMFGRIRDDALLWGFLAALWVGFSLYWFSGGPDFGPRYWYQMILPCAALTVCGAQAFAERLKERTSLAAGKSKVWAFVVLASLVGFVNLITWRSLDKYYHYRRMRPDIRRLEAQLGRSLVFVRGEEFPDYAAAFTFNPPHLGRNAPGPIFVHDVGPESRAHVLSYYNDRPVWILEGPSVTGDGFRVVAGPLAPDEAHH